MRRFLFASVLVLATGGRAEEAVPAASLPAPPPSETSVVSDAVQPGRPRRNLSADTAAKLAAAAPRYESPAPPATPGTDVSGPVSPVARETDRPRNQIIRLPSYIVGEPKLHVPQKELDVMTPKGRADYAMERRPGLRVGPFASLNKAIALEMLEDDLRAERRKEEADLWSLYRIHDVAASEAPATHAKEP